MLQILKSIFNGKGYTLTLIIEIIIVSIIGWIVIEPVAVDTSIAIQPAGYDFDRLINVDFATRGKGSIGFDSLARGEEAEQKGRENLLRMIRQREGVEHATFTSWQAFDTNGWAMTSREADSIYRHGDDINQLKIYKVSYFPKTDFFETFGIKGADGKTFREPEADENSYIISKMIAKGGFPKGSPIGKDFTPKHAYTDESSYHPTPIVGVTADCNYSKGNDRDAVAFIPTQPDNHYAYSGIAIRLKEGVSARSFLDRFKADLKDYRSGNIYLRQPVLYSEMRADRFMEKQRQVTQKWIIVGFFLFNVLLGIAGTFYIQCRKRIPEAGIKRAFGATRYRIETSILAEAWITVFIGWAIGCALYLIWLLHFKEPMYGEVSYLTHVLRPEWYDTAWSRYAIVSGGVLILLLLTATLGAWLPARKVGRVPIVNSLRDE